MIARTATGQGNLAAKAVLISCLCHLVIFGSFIFTIRSRPADTKPLMIFLGSILRKHDVMYAAPASSEKWGKMQPSVSSAPVKDSGEKSLFSFKSTQKPNPAIQQLSEVKQVFKPAMQYAPLPKKSATAASDGSAAQADIAPYQPLKLENNDYR